MTLRNNYIWIKQVFFFFLIVLIYYGCEKLDFKEKPSINTVKVENPTLTTITVIGQLEEPDKSNIKSYGFGWSANGVSLFDPSISGESLTLNVSDLNNQFSAVIPDLEPGQLYYIWAFAINDVGTSYGDTISFYTNYKNAIVITSDITNITANSATCGGNIADDGDAEITQKGVCWSTNRNPTINDSNTSNGSGTGLFTTDITGLTVNTMHYIRAYATNKNGVYYGSEMSFQTKDGLPVISTNVVSNITATSSSCGGNITDDGGYSITVKGVCWSTTQNPTTVNNHTTNGTGTGMFSSNITGLAEWNTYYVRAYATNEIGTAYGEEVSFMANTPVADFDANRYETVKIGNQVWMKENLKTTHYADGEEIVDGSAVVDISGDYTSKYYFAYNDNEDHIDKYGYLYSWQAAMNGASSSSSNPSNVQGACPDGWHIPSDAEWKELEMHLGMTQSDADKTGWRSSDLGLQLKSDTNWSNGGNGNNSSKFDALPAGQRNSNGDYYGLNSHTIFWSSTEYYSSNSWYRKLVYSESGIYRNFDFKSEAASIRCIRNE